MEIFTHNYATAYGRSYAVTPEEYFQESLEPPNRLTNRELQQIRAIREEIESRPKITRFEIRYIRLLKAAEEELCGIRPDCAVGISYIRGFLADIASTTSADKSAISVAQLCGTIARYTR